MLKNEDSRIKIIQISNLYKYKIIMIIKITFYLFLLLYWYLRNIIIIQNTIYILTFIYWYLSTYNVNLDFNVG